jgi:hypothetical protein
VLLLWPQFSVLTSVRESWMLLSPPLSEGVGHNTSLTASILREGVRGAPQSSA